VCGAFFTHIALHSFYGQLLGTFGFLSILRASLYLASEKSPVTLLRRVAFVFPMVLATFITYPLGFVVFFSVSCYSAMVFGLGLWWHRGVFAAFKTTLLRLVVPLLGSLVGLFLLLPEIAIHWYHWTVFVAQTLAGWPLPGLLSPYILFSIPIKLRMKGLYAKPEVYIIAIGILFVMTVFAFRRLRYKDSKCSRLIISSVFIYITFVVVYTIAHIINGSTYQVWKFASFSIMPISFVVLGIVAICIDELLCMIRARRDWVAPFHINLMICIIVFACIFGLYRSGLTQGNWGGKVERINDKIERLKDLKPDLGGTKKVVVDLGPYSMMAFNVLSKDFHLLPTALTYYPPAPLTDSELQPGDTRWLTFSDCMEVMESTPRELQRRSFAPLESDFVIMEPGMVVGAYRFWREDGGCMLCRELKTTGLDGISSWGRSSDGNRVTIGYELPPVLKGQAIRFTFRVVPYVSGNVMAQNIIVSVGGIYYRTFEMRGLGFLRVDVPAEETLASQVVIQFDLPNAFCAENDGALSLDGRILGVRFVDLAIERIAHD
jgi:hypothetical protein